MGQQHHRPRLVLADLQQPRRHVQRIADSGLLEEADVMLADLQRGRPSRGEGPGHAERAGQARQPLHGVSDIEAHIQVPHLVALPGVDTASPDLDPAFEHGRKTPSRGPRQSLSRTASLQVLLTKKICCRMAARIDGSYTVWPHISA
jgi:hypothetical protein